MEISAGILPVDEVVAPGDADAGVLIEYDALVFRPRSVEEKQCLADGRFIPEVDDGSRGETALCPRPLFLTEGDEGSGVVPVGEIRALQQADSVLGRMPEPVFAVDDCGADVFAAFGAAVIVPVLQCTRSRDQESDTPACL